MSIIDFLVSPFGYAFMTRSFLAALIVGVVCATVGTFVVLRGMAFFGDALAHAILPGLALGYLLGNGGRQPLFWGALLAALVSALGIGAISKGTKIREDTAIGVVFAGMFALGIALISTAKSYSIDLAHFLFGDILSVSTNDLIRMTAISIVVLLVIIGFYKEFMVLTFDPLLAQTLRLPARLLDYTFLILVALTVVASLQTVGVALVVAILITPAAAAFLLSQRLPVMITLAVAIACLSGVIGLYFSYYAGVASGAAIVLTNTAFFLIAWMISFIKTQVKKNGCIER